MLRPGQAHLVAAVEQLRRGQPSIARRQSSTSYAAVPIGSRAVLVVLRIRVLAVEQLQGLTLAPNEAQLGALHQRALSLRIGHHLNGQVARELACKSERDKYISGRH